MAAPSSLHWRIKLAVVAKIVDLDLQGDGDYRIGNKVHGQMLPDETGIDDYPCVIATTEGEREKETGKESSGYCDLWLPVRLFIADRSSGRQHELEPFYMYWRDQLYNAFHQKKLEGVNEVRGCEVTMNVIFDPKLPQYQFVVSGMLLNFYTRQRR